MLYNQPVDHFGGFVCTNHKYSTIYQGVCITLNVLMSEEKMINFTELVISPPERIKISLLFVVKVCVCVWMRDLKQTKLMCVYTHSPFIN